MNIFSEIRLLVIDCLDAMVAEGALPPGLAFDQVAVEPPRDAAHGDMATNAAMVLAKPAKMTRAKPSARRVLILRWEKLMVVHRTAAMGCSRLLLREGKIHHREYPRANL